MERGGGAVEDSARGEGARRRNRYVVPITYSSVDGGPDTTSSSLYQGPRLVAEP